MNETRANHSPFRNILKLLVIIGLLFLSADLFYKWYMTGTLTGIGFSDSDIQKIENDIKEKYDGKNGLSVEKVALIKTSDTTLEGFVELRNNNNDRIQQSCEAKKGENLRIIWKCSNK